MRRVDGTKAFKARRNRPFLINVKCLYKPQGSVFVEFADFKSVENFLNADPKPLWKGEDLLIMTKCLFYKALLSHLTN